MYTAKHRAEREDPKREVRARTEAEPLGKCCLLTDLLPGSRSAGFCMQPRTTCPEMVRLAFHNHEMLIVRMEGGQLWFSRAKEQRRTCQTCKYVFSQKGYQKTKGRCIQLETQYHRESLPAHHVLGAEGLNPLSASSSQRKNLLACFHCLLRYPLGTAEACCRATLVFDLHPLPPS